MSTVDWDPDILTHRSFHDDPNLFHIRVPEYIGTEQAISFLSSNPNVEYVEKNLVRHLQYDPYFQYQWGLFNDGSNGGTYRADIHAPEAWNIFTGSSNVIVAVIDTGVDYNHEDLSANIWINPGEIPGNGIDDDHNGYTDDWHGWNFVSNNNDPMDDCGHGTHVAGIIGGVGNNGKGIHGVCWNVKIMILRIGGSSQSMTSGRIISAIDYATTNGAYLSNNSYGKKGDYSQSESDAILRALAKGKLFIAAAGNFRRDNDQNPFYPANYSCDNIVSVLATDDNDCLSTFSNYGSTSVDIGAPGGGTIPTPPPNPPPGPYVQESCNSTGNTGGDIFSTFWVSSQINQYAYLSGTSMATPFVSGTAALALGMCPAMYYAQLKSRIISGRDINADLQGKCVSNGRINAYNVLYDSTNPTTPNAPSNLTGFSTAWNNIYLYWNDNSNNELGFEIQRQLPSQPGFYFIFSVDSNVNAAQDTTVYGGTNNYRVRAGNLGGMSSFTSTSVTIPNTVPTAPTNLYAPNPSISHNVNLTWDDNANNELHYLIERKPLGSGIWTLIATIVPDFTSYTDTQVGAGTYYYRVRANNPVGNSAYSNVIIVEVINN